MNNPRKGQDMKKISFGELENIMMRHNSEKGYSNPSLTGVIVYKQSNFDKPYTEQERSYRVSNSNKYFCPWMIGRSLFGDCLDGRDINVRLDWYNWEPEYCYMDNDEE